MSSASPVFVVGAPRSGTTLLYHMLLSAGGFAYYRAETHAYSLVGPRFGWLRSERHRFAFWNLACNGFLFQRAGISTEEAQAIVLTQTRDVGSFLGNFMSAICQAQDVPRWAECTPDHALFLRTIAQDFPDARFIHILRDGRDVALSLARQQWIQRLPLDSAPPEVAAGFYWEWLVQRARRDGNQLADRFLEVRFEDLVQDPRRTLAVIGPFIGAELDYSRIIENGIGSVSRPNSSYADSRDGAPVGRWLQADPQVRKHLWSALGATLTELGYAPDPDHSLLSNGPGAWRRAYHSTFTAKHGIRTGTPLGQWLVKARLLENAEPL